MKSFTLTLDEIISRVGENEALSVDVTPDGHGDCVQSVIEISNTDGMRIHHRRMFVKPHEVKMSIGNFRDALRRCQGDDLESINYCHQESIEAEIDANGLVAYQLHTRLVDDENVVNDCSFDGNRQRPVVYYSKQVCSIET
jgi:hypothetical protein